MSGCDVVWIIMARSTSSKWPRRRSSGLPPRNSSRPARACWTRHSTSPYSSAGTAKKTTRPARCSKARAQQPRHLGIVAAGVCGAGLGIGDRMSRHHQAVQLAEQREGRTVLDARGLGPHAGEGEAAPRLEPELAERLLGQPRGLELLEAELGLAADALPQADDALGVPVDALADAVFQVLLGRHREPPKKETGRGETGDQARLE